MKKLKLLRTSLLIALLPMLFMTSCKEDDGNSPKPTKEATVLDCNYFNEDRVLTHDPEKAVDYIVNCNMSISADIKIEQGVVIEFEQSASIKLDGSKGSLVATGTSESPIILRGAKKEKGYWKGLFFNSSSPLIQLNYVHVEDAGGEAFNSNGDKGGIIVYANTDIKMENCKVTNSKTNGLNAVYSGNTLTLNNNIFTGNNYPAYVAASNINALNSTNKFSGNETDYILIYAVGSPASINIPTTWYNNDVPYKIEKGTTVEVKDLLTIEPGVTIEFPQEGVLKISEVGGIKAVGTVDNPIVFTGIAKVSKAWKGIYILGKNPENEIAFAEVHYSGVGTVGNIYLWYESTLNIHDVTFKNINGCGVNYRSDKEKNLTIGANIVVGLGGCDVGTW